MPVSHFFWLPLAAALGARKVAVPVAVIGLISMYGLYSIVVETSYCSIYDKKGIGAAIDAG
jgi:hypothetical protein